MIRSEYYAGWKGKCRVCGHNYFACRGNCTCLACNAQRQKEIKEELEFEEDKFVSLEEQIAISEFKKKRVKKNK